MPKFSLEKLARTLPRKFSRPAHHVATSHSSGSEKCLSEMEIFTGGEGDALRRKNKAEADGVPHA